MVDLIGHNYIGIASRLSRLIYLYIASANDNEFYYSLPDMLLLCKRNILDPEYPSPKLDHLPVMYILIPRLCWGSPPFCVPFSRGNNIIGAVIFPHSYCGFAWTCFMHCAEDCYGLKLVPIDSSDVGQEAPNFSDCRILVIEILLEFGNGGLGEVQYMYRYCILYDLRRYLLS